MSAFADTSFLAGFYFPRADSARAHAKIESLDVAPLISSLVEFEFRQAAWLKVWLQTQGHPLGISEVAAQNAIAAFDLDLERALWIPTVHDWEPVFARADRLALSHTIRHGARAMDILHVAFALEIGASEFLTFDLNQKAVAEAEGLSAGP